MEWQQVRVAATQRELEESEQVPLHLEVTLLDRIVALPFSHRSEASSPQIPWLWSRPTDQADRLENWW